MRDLTSACASGKVEGRLVLDLNDYEDKAGEADVPVAWMPNFNAITLLQMDGQLTLDEFNQAVNMSIEGCKQIYSLQKEALRTKYITAKEEVEEQ